MNLAVGPINVSIEELKNLLKRARQEPLEEEAYRKLEGALHTLEHIAGLLAGENPGPPRQFQAENGTDRSKQPARDQVVDATIKNLDGETSVGRHAGENGNGAKKEANTSIGHRRNGSVAKPSKLPVQILGQTLNSDYHAEHSRPDVPPHSSGILPQNIFLRVLRQERKRTERSRLRFVLMLVEFGQLLNAPNKQDVLEKVLQALAHSIRDTDTMGWYKAHSVIGVIFTEIDALEEKSVISTLATKVTDSLYTGLTIEQINQIKLSFHVFPEDWDNPGPGGPAHTTLNLNLSNARHDRAALHLKRFVDILGSLAGLILCLPVLLTAALAIKLTSRGPIIFRQARIGQYGKKFTLLKFRSMYFGNDHSIHERYVKQFIAGAINQESTNSNQPLQFKLTADPRITPVGRFLRKTSLDELPQFLNVLLGDMSLVGPRPPVTYEFENYELWHKQRLVAVKPGITGLWQVYGRSRVTFDDMVRLDIRYAQSWSLWLDLKILLQTPRAVFSGNGAC